MSTETTVKRACPKCGKVLKIPSKYVGLKVECMHCKAHFVVKPPQAGGGVQLADEDEKIPIDEELAALKARSAESSAEQPTVSPGSTATTTPEPSSAEQSTQEQASSGKYMVAKVHMGGRMAHTNLEDTLNKYGADGWQFVYAVHHGTELYVIFRRS